MAQSDRIVPGPRDGMSARHSTSAHAGDAAEDLAIVKVLSSRYYDFLQMAKIGGKWKIVNVLWVMNPAAVRRR